MGNMIAPGIGGTVGGMLGSAVSGGFGGSSMPSYNGSSIYQPTNMAGANQDWNTQEQANIANNPYTANNSNLNNLLSSVWTNPYGGAAQTSANTAGGALTSTGNAQLGAANNDYVMATGDQNAANQVLNTAFDPQSALYKQSLQNLNDQVNANEAARGITMGGVGSQILNNADAQFNTDWQAQQLANQVQGLQAASGANVNASNINAQGGNIATQGAGNIAQGGMLPYTTYTNDIGNQLNTAAPIMGTQAQANTLNQNNIDSLLQYMGYGTKAGTAQTGAAQTALPYQTQGMSNLMSYVPAITNAFANIGSNPGWIGNTFYG